MSTSLTTLLQAQILSLSHPLSDSDLRSLALLTSSSLLVDALDLVDKGQITQITLPNGRHLYQVAGTWGAYSVHPDLPSPRLDGSSEEQPNHQLGYCPCPAFSYGVFQADHQVICKHLLAVKLAQHLGAPTLVKKEMGLRWLAAVATSFASAPAEQAGAAGAGAGAGGGREGGA